MCLVGGFSVAILGVIYAYGLAWIPIVYISFLLTGGIGGVLGFILGACGKAGKVRDSFVVGVMGLLAAVLALYVAWAFDGMARFGTQDIPAPMF